MGNVSDLLKQLQDSLVDDSISLAASLRKALILAHQLNNEDFKKWIFESLEGYVDSGPYNNYQEFMDAIPEFRKVLALSYVVYIVHDYQVTWPLTSDIVPESFHLVPITGSVSMLEDLKDRDDIHFAFPRYKEEAMIKILKEQGKTYIRGYHTIQRSHISQILSTIKNRLLRFTLELGELSPEIEEKLNLSQALTPNIVQYIQYVVDSTILNNNVANGELFTMTTNYDQRNQQVAGNQYNAGRDITFNEVHNRDELISELEKLKTDLSNLLVESELEEDVKADAEYNMTKAVIAAKKAEPEKQTILSHINKVKEILTDVGSMATAIIAIQKAVEVIDNLPFIA